MYKKFIKIFEESGLTQREFARRIGVVYSYLAVIKSKKYRVTENMMVRILKKIKGMSEAKAWKQVAEWKGEESGEKPNVSFHGHSGIYFGGSINDSTINIGGLKKEDQKIIKYMVKSLKEKK